MVYFVCFLSSPPLLFLVALPLLFFQHPCVPLKLSFGPHRFRLYSCSFLSAELARRRPQPAGRATAAEDDLSIRRFSRSPGVPGRGAPFWRGAGLGTGFLSPLRGFTWAARLELKVGADGVFSMVCGPGPHCSGRPWNPSLLEWTGGGFTGIPLKVGALGRYMGNAFLAKLCAVGGRTCSMGGCLLGESGCPLRVALWLKTPFQHPQPSQGAFSGLQENGSSG